MLSTPTPFPQQGSRALLGRLPVRIIQPRPDGRALVSGHLVDGTTFTRTVAVNELADAAMPAHPLDRWIAERLAESSAYIPAGDLHRDLAEWCRDRGLDDRSIPGQAALNAQLRERGFRAAQRQVASPVNGTRLCFAATLRPLAEAL